MVSERKVNTLDQPANVSLRFIPDKCIALSGEQGTEPSHSTSLQLVAIRKSTLGKASHHGSAFNS